MQKPRALHIQKVGGLRIKKKKVFGDVRGRRVKINSEIKVWYKEKKISIKKNKKFQDVEYKIKNIREDGEKKYKKVDNKKRKKENSIKKD